MAEQWDSGLGLWLDNDLRAAMPLATPTVPGFEPLIAGSATPERAAALLATLNSTAFLGHRALRWPVLPSTCPADPGFRPRSYWRGPTWPVITWLLWCSLVRAGKGERAARLREAGLGQLGAVGFAEYVETVTGEPLSSLDQSRTAAVALDWLAA